MPDSTVEVAPGDPPPAGPPPAPNMSIEWPQRPRRAPARSGSVSILEHDVSPLTDVEATAVTNRESRPNSRDLSFIKPPVPQVSDSSAAIASSRNKAGTSGSRSPTVRAKGRSPGPASKASRQSANGKRKELDSGPQTPKKCQRQDESHDVGESRHEPARACRSTRNRIGYDSDEIIVVGPETVGKAKERSQGASSQTLSTHQQPTDAPSPGEQEIHSLIFAAFEDNSAGSVSKRDNNINGNNLDTAYLRRECNHFNDIEKKTKQLKEDRRLLCTQLCDISAEDQASKLEAVRQNGETISNLQTDSRVLHAQISSVVQSCSFQSDESSTRGQVKTSDTLNTEDVLRLCDGYDENQRKIEQIVEQQKQIMAQLLDCI